VRRRNVANSMSRRDFEASSFEDASKDVPLASKFLLAAFSDYDCKTPKEDVLLWHFR